MRPRALLAAASALLVLVAPISQATAASNPPPPKTLQTPGIDAHLGYKAQSTCSPEAKPGTSRLMKALIAKWGGANWGISRFCSSGGVSEHKEGRALDWHMDSRKASDRAKVNEMITWVTANNGEVAYRLGIMYIIWNQRIWSIYYQELGWRTMADRGSWTANHKDHVHISLSWDGAMAQTSWWTGKILTVPQLGPCGTRSYAACLPVIGRSSSTSWTRVSVGPFTPYPSNVPAIAGSARVGLTLRLVRGTWPPAGATFNQRWQRDGRSIPGATGETYTLTADDVGHAITVRVRATLGASSVVKTSDETTDTVKGVFPTPRPSVSGTYVYGSILKGTPGAGFPAGTSFAYQWQRDGTDISSASSSTYQVREADIGRGLRLRVRAKLRGWITDYTYTVNATVQPKTFLATATPVIDGIVRVGGELTTNTGTWTPPATFSYRWYRDGKQISGATSKTYTLTSADKGSTIKVRVSASRKGYTSVATYSKATATVGSGITSHPVTIEDSTPRVGQNIGLKRGVWQPDPVSYRYKWYRDGEVIDGATARRYTVTAADYGKRLRVRVIGTKEGYPAVNRLSAETSKVAAGSLSTSGVSVSGDAVVGGTVTASEGTWSSADDPDVKVTPAFDYQWYADGTPIDGATAQTYTPTDGQRSAELTVVVTAASTRYAPASATSRPVTIE